MCLRLGPLTSVRLRGSSSVSSSQSKQLSHSSSFSGQTHASDSLCSTKVEFPDSSVVYEVIAVVNDFPASGFEEKRQTASHPNTEILYASLAHLQAEFLPPVCRICKKPAGPEAEGLKLFRPCKCEEDLMFVHEVCIDKEYYTFREDECKRCWEKYYLIPVETPPSEVS